MAYPMYNNQYYINELQAMKDRIDTQIRQHQNQYQQPVQQPQIHQSFQLAPQSNISEIQAKYVTDINEVQNTFVMSLGMFVNKELNTMWLKNTNGEIRTFNLNEIIEKDPKDIEIDSLKQELEEMKLLIKNSQNTNEVKESNVKNKNKVEKK